MKISVLFVAAAFASLSYYLRNVEWTSAALAGVNGLLLLLNLVLSGRVLRFILRNKTAPGARKLAYGLLNSTLLFLVPSAVYLSLFESRRIEKTYTWHFLMEEQGFTKKDNPKKIYALMAPIQGEFGSAYDNRFGRVWTEVNHVVKEGSEENFQQLTAASNDLGTMGIHLAEFLIFQKLMVGDWRVERRELKGITSGRDSYISFGKPDSKLPMSSLDRNALRAMFSDNPFFMIPGALALPGGSRITIGGGKYSREVSIAGNSFVKLKITMQPLTVTPLQRKVWGTNPRNPFFTRDMTMFVKFEADYSMLRMLDPRMVIYRRWAEEIHSAVRHFSWDEVSAELIREHDLVAPFSMKGS